MRYRWRPSSTAQLPFQQLLENNDLGIIDNPLRRIPEKHLREFIDSFFKESELAKVTNFTNLFRGARLARDEEAFGQEDTLTDVEKAALEKEKSRDPEEDPNKDRRREPSLWAESREIKIILLICCVASITQGWAQAAIVGANQGWPRALNLQLGRVTNGSDKATEPLVTGDVWRFSATNAIVYFAASSVGAYLSDPLTDILMGRRGAIFIAALSTFTASIGQAYAQSWRALFAWRFLLGIGMGAKSSVVPVYESEVAPAQLRGKMVISWQGGTALGIALAGLVALATEDWRVRIASSAGPAIVLPFLALVGSESPRWLIKKQRYCEAYTSLLRLRENPLLAARDLVLIWAQLRRETTLFMDAEDEIINIKNEIPYLRPDAYKRQIGFFGYARRVTQLFTIPRVRRATVASFVVMTAQQLTGVNVFAFLASTLFDQGENQENPTRGSLRLYFGFGIVNFLASLMAYFFIDRKGRRWLLMLSLAAMFPLLLATAWSFRADGTLQQGLVATFLILYTIAYSPGVGAVPFLYSSEIFPQTIREVGMAWASSVCWFGAGILDLGVPSLIPRWKQTRVLCFFAGLDVLALILVWLLVPGTERRTMEEMNYIFGVSTYRHIKYQVNEVLPWCVDYYLKGHKDKNPCPFLYRRARDAGDEGDQNEGGEKTNGEGRGGAGNSIALQSSRSNA